jgi:hypothetical protein
MGQAHTHTLPKRGEKSFTMRGYVLCSIYYSTLPNPPTLVKEEHSSCGRLTIKEHRKSKDTHTFKKGADRKAKKKNTESKPGHKKTQPCKIASAFSF